ncbi:MAG: hypothetical protein FJ100_20900 [Deltaproteobacteria bacterium]|nr:hypothetical protein [Deltaproteobacteria bacterium]
MGIAQLRLQQSQLVATRGQSRLQVHLARVSLGSGGIPLGQRCLRLSHLRLQRVGAAQLCIMYLSQPLRVGQRSRPRSLACSNSSGSVCLGLGSPALRLL